MLCIQTQTTTDVGGGLNVGFIGLGDWMEYTVVVPQTGSYTIDFRIAGTNATWSFDILANGSFLKTITGINTGGFQNWNTISTTIYLTERTQTIRFYANASGWNINWFEVKQTNLSVDNFSIETIKVYPNPVNKILNLSDESPWTLISPTGQLLETGIGKTIEMSGRIPGLYFVKVKTGIVKIIKE